MRRLFLASFMVAAMLIPAASASAAPTGEYAKFAQCPTGAPGVEFCIYAETTSGKVKTGNKTVPIVNKTVLQAGADPVINNEPFGPLNIVGAKNGETLTRTPQPVPGGLLGIQAPSWWPSLLRNLFNETINNGFTGVQATMELAGPPSAIQFNLVAAATGQGTALAMPVKVKLSNPFLGNNCYIGSNSNPIQLKLTSGTTSPPPPNQPISGNPGHLEGREEGNIIAVLDNKLVDNAFSVPGANGCGGILFSWAIDPFVESIVGIPSPAGNNEVILEGSTFLGYAPAVKASEP
jgi:hypothetical protein